MAKGSVAFERAASTAAADRQLVSLLSSGDTPPSSIRTSKMHDPYRHVSFVKPEVARSRRKCRRAFGRIVVALYWNSSR
eukprot:2346552-Pleurochrysis_carterae.AAC.2